MHAENEIHFRDSAAKALLDPQLRANFRRAMDGLITKRRNQFPDPRDLQDLRDLSTAIRSRSLLNLPALLEQFEANCTKNGIQVHWAETCEQANELILGILQAKGAKTLVKGKSMVSEEMHLNAYLESKGIEALESDLGEYIIQLDGETPSHIIMPAIHKNKDQIARQFSQKIKDAKYTEDVDELTAMARKVLRQKFLDADAGLSGVNFAVAETGTLCLVENEGNGRMSTHVPPLHIAVMGLEKVVARLEDVAPLYAILTRSATGQAVSTYFNLISGPRGDAEKDGPQEVHLVILDNGRSRIYADPQLRATLRCIRCGACMNHCPVYTRVGGHAYEAIYPGPIGKILTPQMEGVGVRHDLIHGSSLCGACGEVCPVEIPIPEILVRLRREATHEDAGSTVAGKGTGRTASEDWAWRLWAGVLQRPALYRLATWFATRFGKALPANAPLIKAWTQSRTKPVPARRSLSERVRAEGVPMSDPRPDSASRTAILGRLRAAGDAGALPALDTAVLERRQWPAAERVVRLRKGMEAVHTEFLEATPATWPAVVRAFCDREGLANLLYGPASEAGAALAEAWAPGGPQLMPYDRPVEAFKQELFTGVEAGFTGTVGGVAETGGLLLMPGPAEPRLMSLVPPIHIALLRASTIMDSFWSAVKALGWGRSLPPNALLISGPSKTADIEQTLAYGVHGPKRLIVVLVDDLA